MKKILMILILIVTSTTVITAETLEPIENEKLNFNIERVVNYVPFTSLVTPFNNGINTKPYLEFFTQQELIDAAEGTELEGLTNIDGTVPQYLIINVEQAYKSQHAFMIGKTFVFVYLNKSVQDINFVRHGHPVSGYGVGNINNIYTSSFILDNGVLKNTRNYFTNTQYNSFFDATKYVTPSVVDVYNEVKVNVLSMYNMSFRDEKGNLSLNNNFSRLTGFEQSVFLNKEQVENSELYNLYIITATVFIAWKLLKPIVWRFNPKGRGYK